MSLMAMLKKSLAMSIHAWHDVLVGQTVRITCLRVGIRCLSFIDIHFC
jgi:hypothetical protein